MKETAPPLNQPLKFISFDFISFYFTLSKGPLPVCDQGLCRMCSLYVESVLSIYCEVYLCPWARKETAPQQLHQFVRAPSTQ